MSYADEGLRSLARGGARRAARGGEMSGTPELPRAENIFFDGRAGRLEGLYRPPPPGGASHAALLCHPHPVYGGTMHNRVIFQFEREFAKRGRATLRFNFRGAGASEGVHDGGPGEEQDVLTAYGELRRRSDAATVDLLGYSFGCWVSWRALRDEPAIGAMAGVGVPLRLIDFDFAGSVMKRITIVQGSEDEFASGSEVRAFAASLHIPPRLFIIEGADHLFTRGYERLLATIPEIVSGL